MRPGLQLDEISLLHGIPPWKIESSRPRPNAWGRLLWRIRAIVYRVGLQRLAAAGLGATPE